MSGPQEDRYRAMRMLETLCDRPDFRVVVVDGEPPSKGRPRFTKKGRPYTPRVTLEGENRIAGRFAGLGPFEGNVAVACVFHRRSRQRIDIDNLLKAVLDGGTRAAIWNDDSQVTALVGVLEHDHAQPRTVVAFGHHATTMQRGDDAMRSCDACGKRFLPAGARGREMARWCSKECQTYLLEPVPCPYCAEPFKRRLARQKYCSVECRGLAQRARRVCIDCGAPISKTKYERCRACWIRMGNVAAPEAAEPEEAVA
jgi:Holliday junction resolvase RusA-like endonuclease